MHFFFVCILDHNMIWSDKAILQSATFLHYCFIANHAILNDTPENIEEKKISWFLKCSVKLCAISNEIVMKKFKEKFFFSPISQIKTDPSSMMTPLMRTLFEILVF